MGQYYQVRDKTGKSIESVNCSSVRHEARRIEEQKPGWIEEEDLAWRSFGEDDRINDEAVLEPEAALAIADEFEMLFQENGDGGYNVRDTIEFLRRWGAAGHRIYSV